MDTQSFQVAELLMDAALNKQFKFTTQQAVNYILPKLSGPPKRRESVIKSAIRRGLKEELYLECGDQYLLALPPVHLVQDSQQNISCEMDTDWDMSDVTVNKTETLKKKPSSKRVKKGVATRIEEKKTTRHPKGKKTKRSKMVKTNLKQKIQKVKTTKKKMGESKRQRIKRNNCRSDSMKSVLSKEEMNDLSKCMISIGSLDKISERKSSNENEEFEEDSCRDYTQSCSSNEASCSKNFLERKRSDTEDINYRQTNTDCRRPDSSNSNTSFYK